MNNTVPTLYAAIGDRFEVSMLPTVINMDSGRRKLKLCWFMGLTAYIFVDVA